MKLRGHPPKRDVPSALNRGNPNEEKENPERECSIVTERTVQDGFCTFYGACRVTDGVFMYQGGCGEASQWGNKTLLPMKVKCRLETKARLEIFGCCNNKSFCIFEGTSRPGSATNVRRRSMMGLLRKLKTRRHSCQLCIIF